MRTIQFDRKSIEDVFYQAENILLDKKNLCVIKYSDFDHTTFDANNQELLNAISGQQIVYCIWTGTSQNTLAPKYIGHAGSKISRQRVRNHLTKKNAGTGAKLDNIKEVLYQKKCIGFSTVSIKPGYMRKALEDWLIDKHTEILEWNQVGRKKQLKVTTKL